MLAFRISLFRRLIKSWLVLCIASEDNAIASVKLGLFYNDELVSVMTFRKPRFNKKFEYEIIRFCSSANIVGASKLFQFL